MFLKKFIISLRPQQWIKNFFVFAALIFARKFTDMAAIEKALAAFALFCLVSSGIYLINDVVDCDRDKQHPIKKNRPIASGEVNKKLALVLAVVLIILSASLSFIINRELSAVVLAYALLNLFYSLYLKNVVILDIISIAVGFVLRVIAGAVAVGVVFSSWLLLCTFFLTLFLAIGKRKNELVVLGGADQRAVLKGYSLELLDQMNAVVLPSTLITYALYTFTSGHSQWLVITVPVVLYGLFRYLYIVDKKRVSGNGPSDDLLYDRPLQLTVTVWILIILAIFLYTK